MPKKPQLTPGGNKSEIAHNEIVQFLGALRPMRGYGTKTTFSPNGVVRKSSPQNLSRSVGNYIYRITNLYNADYVGATLFDQSQYDPDNDFVTNGGDESAIAGDPSLSGGQLIVAKCIYGQQVESEVIDGFNIEYDYSNENLRAATADTLGNEWQVCHPRYTVGDYIVVTKLKNFANVMDDNGQPFSYIEISPSREWCYQNGQEGDVA